MSEHEHMPTKYSGSPYTFQDDPVGTFTYSSFPAGWYDVAQISPDSTAPQPSAVVITTNDSSGHETKALATLPGIAESQGIYRSIDLSNFYKTKVDVRVDQFSDVDPSVAVEDPNNPGFLICGCPVGSEDLLDWPASAGFALLDGNADIAHVANAGLSASAETHTWHLSAGTQNVLADVDLGIHVKEGKWYGLETDFDATSGELHGVVTDISGGAVLADKMVFLQDPQYGKYDPAVDGKFNAEAYTDGEITLFESLDPTLTKPGLAVFDNIDSSNHGSAYASGQGYDYGNHWDGIACDHGENIGWIA